MKKALVAALVMLTACSGGPEQQVVPQGDSTAQNAPADRDEQVFAATMERARREHLDTLPIGEVVARVGTWFVGAPYTPRTLEPPGPEGLVVNLREFDCVTYVESMLAIARVIKSGQTSFTDFQNQLRTIRYRGGELRDYPTRLHYFTDWIRDNQAMGIVSDQTQQLGGAQDPERIDFMTRNRQSYRQLADSGFFNRVKEQEVELSAQPRYMIPEQRIAAVAERIKNGDVIAATSSVRGLDVAHTGLALWQDGELHLMHAPLVGDSVEISERTLADRIMSIDRQDGIMVARPNEPGTP